MNTDNDMINSLLGNMRLRGNQSPQCNVQIHPASSDYPDLNETYRCRIHVNENYSDTPPDAQTSNLEIQGTCQDHCHVSEQQFYFLLPT